MATRHGAAPDGWAAGCLMVALALCACGCGKKKEQQQQQQATSTVATTSTSRSPSTTTSTPASTSTELRIDVNRAKQVVAVLEKGSIIEIAKHCGDIEGCVDEGCAKVLRVCATATIDRCAEFLRDACREFPAGALTGAELTKAAQAWILESYRAVVDQARGLLGPDEQKRLDVARKRLGV